MCFSEQIREKMYLFYWGSVRGVLAPYSLAIFTLCSLSLAISHPYFIAIFLCSLFILLCFLLLFNFFPMFPDLSVCVAYKEDLEDPFIPTLLTFCYGGYWGIRQDATIHTLSTCTISLVCLQTSGKAKNIPPYPFKWSSPNLNTSITTHFVSSLSM